MKLTVLLLAAVAVTACTEGPSLVQLAQEPADTVRSYPVYVVNHGWHAGLIIPASHLNEAIPELGKRFGSTFYYEIGWGDREFYQARPPSAELAAQAIVRSTGSVLHIAAVPGSPTRYFQPMEVVNTCLTKEQVESLVTYVSNSFARDHRGNVMQLGQGLYGNSQFYAGQGNYSLLNTCNTWISGGLKSAGIDLSPPLTLTSGSVMRSIRALRQRCTSRPNPEDHE
jgi:uncharacterized protein (TIGR02117 family)